MYKYCRLSKTSVPYVFCYSRYSLNVYKRGTLESLPDVRFRGSPPAAHEPRSATASGGTRDGAAPTPPCAPPRFGLSDFAFRHAAPSAARAPRRPPRRALAQRVPGSARRRGRCSLSGSGGPSTVSGPCAWPLEAEFFRSTSQHPGRRRGRAGTNHNSEYSCSPSAVARVARRHLPATTRRRTLLRGRDLSRASAWPAKRRPTAAGPTRRP